MVVFGKDKIPTDWKSLAGQGICIVAVTPMTFASNLNIRYKTFDYQTVENSLCARSYERVFSYVIKVLYYQIHRSKSLNTYFNLLITDIFYHEEIDFNITSFFCTLTHYSDKQ